MDRWTPAERRRLFGGDSKGLSASTSTNADEITTTVSVPIPKSTCLDDLPDHVFVEILLKVPPKSLHRFKCVSKHWLSLISAPSFACSYNNVQQSPTKNMMLLFKIQHHSHDIIEEVYGFPLFHDDFDKSLPLPFDFIPTLRPDDCHDFHDGRSPTRLMDMDLRGISGGLVLLQGIFRGINDTRIYYHNYVCNPITKEWVELPPLISTGDIIGFTAYYTRQVEEEGPDTRIWGHTSSYDNFTKHISSYDPNRIEFTVVSINRDNKDYNVFIIRVFSSGDVTAGWSVFRVPVPRGYSCFCSPTITKVLFLNGKFHWIGNRCIAVYDPFNKPLECDVIQWPLDASDAYNNYTNMFLEACQGHLRMGNLYMNSTFVVWELVDYDKKAWVKKFDVNLDYYQNTLRFHSFLGAAKAYVLDSVLSTIGLLDLKNGSLQDFTKYPFMLEKVYRVEYLKPFMPSPWPTCVPLRQRQAHIDY